MSEINLQDDGIYKNPPPQQNMDIGLKYLRNEVEEKPFVLRPEYQRDVVWSEKEMGLFVGFILEGGQTQNLIWNNRGLPDGYAVVDGQQRTISCLKFMRNEIPALAHNDNGNLISFYYDDLDDDSKGFMNVNYRLPVGRIEVPKEKEVEIYLKVNRRGKEHTDEELEHAEEILEKYRGG
jgi:hypothetical protein